MAPDVSCSFAGGAVDLPPGLGRDKQSELNHGGIGGVKRGIRGLSFCKNLSKGEKVNHLLVYFTVKHKSSFLLLFYSELLWRRL